AGRLGGARRPESILVVVDATNLARNLIFASQALQQGLPAVVALNMMDLARRRGLSINIERLAEQLGCPVVPVSARTGEGLDALRAALAAPVLSRVPLPDPTSAQQAAEWAERIAAAAADPEVAAAPDRLTDRLDQVLTHPLLGLLVFCAVMTGLFWTIFSLASVPMDLIEILFILLGDLAGALLPAGAIHDLVVEGVVAGIAGTVVFLPQICLLFFLISLLEDTGYLARAVFVMDRLMRRFGLPGHAFVPLLSAHACAIPAIMSARLIPDPRERLATILVAPFMSCSARLPVYVLLIGLLFADEPLLAGLAFAGCYALGATAALVSALVARATLLKGAAPPLVLELPPYRLPSLRTALVTTYERAIVFLKKAGTIIVAICVVLWWLGEYPHVDPPAEAATLRATAAEVAPLDPGRAESLETQAEAVTARHAKAHSLIGRLGRGCEPVFAPLGYDWQITIGILSSFVAREVFVSTMAVVVGGDDAGEDEALRARITGATRGDGSPVFTTATTVSLLVFYVLAMQCLPTLAVTQRETGGWRWAGLQFAYMSGLAYLFALGAYYVVVWWAGTGVA
ncbi:MAG: ferrous iron transporter B, partial [Planctomycetota bacterium]